MTVSTAAVHGIYHFQDINGNEIHLYGNDNRLSASSSGGAVVDVATGTLNATWQCADSVGFAYCLTSSRDSAVRTGGNAGSTTYQSGIPLGTMLTFTPDRLVVSGVSGNESTLYFSKTNTFNTFTTGLLSTDAFTEVISAPGSRITHVKYACGKLLWWKDNSFGYSVGKDQYDIENITVSPNIGTLDNSSDEYNGHVYFRGSDSHIYDYDCSNTVRLSRSITPTVVSANRRKSSLWTQTSQSDFQTGVSSPTGVTNLNIISGAVTVSSFSRIDTSSADWSGGTFSNTSSTQTTTEIQLLLGNQITDQQQLTTNGTVVLSGHDYIAQSFTTNGSVAELAVDVQVSLTQINSGGTLTAALMSDNSNSPGTILYSGTFSCGLGSGFSPLITPGDTVHLDASTKYWIRIARGSSGSNRCEWDYTDLNPYANGSMWDSDSGLRPTDDGVFIVNVKRYASSGTYTSSAYDTGLSSNIISGIRDYTFDTTGGTIVREFQTGPTASGPWTVKSDFPITTNASSRYIRYISTFTGTDNGYTPKFKDITLLAATTGSYYSAVNNAPSLTSWDFFTVTDSTMSGGNVTYYTRSSTNTFAVASSTPVWVAQTKNSVVSASTGTYFQMRADFTLGAASDTPRMDDFTFNWYEGNASDKAYIKYWNESVWVAVSSGSSGLNNRIFRWDLQNNTWLIDDIASNGFLVDQGRLYFGSPSAGKIYMFGDVTTDDNVAINAYWKSKDFSGADPFVQNTFDQSDFIVKSASGTTLTATYQIDGSTTTSYSLNLYDNNRSIIKKGTNLPGKLGTFYSIKFGDNSVNPKWEVLGYRCRYTAQPWRPN